MNSDRTSSDAEAVREQMRTIRERMAGEAVNVADGARQLADWRFYVQRFPGPVLAACAAVGYLAVPRRLQVMSPDLKTLEKLARKNKLVLQTNPGKSEKKPGLMDTVVSLAGTLLLRSATNYASQHFGNLLRESPRPRSEEMHS